MTPQNLAFEDYRTLLTPQAKEIIANSHSLSAWVNSRCVAAAGVIQHWPGRGEAWFVATKEANSVMVPIMRRMRDVLPALPFRRIEFVVKAGHRPGEKIAKALGFTKERTMRKYDQHGGDADMYVRVE